uniref:Kinesin motor domain-containing protein n=1 Tax=Panagrellus redivivus TaxID=6233 RepID=A0A7E4ZYZ4_PANRE
MTLGPPGDEAGNSKVQVAVRVRPFNKRERDLDTKCILQMEADQTFLYHPTDEKTPKTFSFDHCFESSDPDSRKFASQEDVFEKVGSSVVNNAFGGYNACIFAYGQTGSGKSYTMMGSPDNPGIIPRLCNAIFERITVETCESASFKVEVSYMEIYNERVRDLLDPKKSAKSNLKVREHKSLGPMVDGLSVLAVSSFDQIGRLMDEGNKCRTVAATNMNAESSRSHAVFTIRLTHIMADLDAGFSGEKVSKISLVDLAGSERAGKTGAMGKRLEEGGNINKSLTTLGMVISALAEKSGKKEKFVPYRDSVLTWLLKDNLGGNSKTVMIATVSPSADNYEETLGTLRYADRAKKIVNHAVVNEDPNAKVIRELREEVESLRTQISQTKEKENQYDELKERLAESERLVEQMNKSWEVRLQETDIVYKERQRDLAQIGISVAEGGIKVEKDRFYLVNLNADPSLNELLVYYINRRAVVGSGAEADDDSPSARPLSPDAEGNVDFVLQGLGVHSRHAVLNVVDEADGKKRLYIEPLVEGARICVNGRSITEPTLLRNGFRLLIGHNHFFRVNCPKDVMNDSMAASLMVASTMMDESHIDYDRAWLEANSDEPAAVSHVVDQYLEHINIKHQEEKQAALEKQYEEFERYIHGLTQTLQTPSTPMTPAMAFPMASTPSCALPPVGFPLNPRNVDKTKFFKWAQRREEVFKESLKTLKTEIVRANALVREANMIADELMANKRGQTRYDVTLQIPAANLRPSRIKAGTSVCEPVIVVKRNGMQGYQLWSVEQLENRLVDMREAYNDRIASGCMADGGMAASNLSVLSESPTSSGICADEDEEDINGASDGSLIDTLFESQEKHSLIGVANVFLEVLFHELKLDYHVPIVSQQGEVCGKLHVEVYRLPDPCIMSDSTDSIESGSSSSQSHHFLGKTIRCRVRIKKATNLPQSLSHFVFCQYSFFNISEMLVVAPVFDSKNPHTHATNVKFDHQRDFDVLVTEEFLEYVQEDALSIEVWGHRSAGLEPAQNPTVAPSNGVLLADTEAAAKQKGLHERWSEVTSRIELFVDVQELNENGEYTSVEVVRDSGVPTGGIYQLKQGQQRRVSVRAKVVGDRGSLPLAFTDLSTVSIGSIIVKDSNDPKQMDSYQEDDLDRIREQWTLALSNRQKYLEQQINSLSEKGHSKTSHDSEREKALINQWVALTEERNAVSVPAANSHIPGAPADWVPPPGLEQHVPVVFLDINPEEFSVPPDAADSDNEDEDNLRSMNLSTSDDISSCMSLSRSMTASATAASSVKLAGLNNALPGERFDQMVLLPIVTKDIAETAATCSWDSSLHANAALNRATASGERVYAIVRVALRLSQPLAIDLVLRKRVCFNVYKKPSFAGRLMRRIVGSETLFGTGVFYDVVAHIPKATLDMEDRETLAMMAARHTSSTEEEDDEKMRSRLQSSYIEAYTKSIQAVEWMLKLDRLRQESAIFSALSKQERSTRLSNAGYGLPSNSFRMKRAVSLPNTMNNASLPPIPPSSRMSNINGYNNNNDSNAAASKLMETSTSSSSGYSSMVNSLVSPQMEQSCRLSGIDEEQIHSELLGKEPVRSFTVPETLHSSTNEHFSPKIVSPRLLTDLSHDVPKSNNFSSSNGAPVSYANRLFDDDTAAVSHGRSRPTSTNLEFDVSHA